MPIVAISIIQGTARREREDRNHDGAPHLLKFVIVAVNVLSAFMVIVLEVSRVAAMLVLPQGRALFGRWTSLRTGVPATPRTGETAACALTCSVAERRTAEAVMRGAEKNMIIILEVGLRR